MAFCNYEYSYTNAEQTILYSLRLEINKTLFKCLVSYQQNRFLNVDTTSTSYK